MIQFNQHDRSTWPAYYQRVRLRVVRADGTQWGNEIMGEFRPPVINLKHDRFYDDTGQCQFIIATDFFDTDDGLLIPGKNDTLNHIEWAV